MRMAHYSCVHSSIHYLHNVALPVSLLLRSSELNGMRVFRSLQCALLLCIANIIKRR
jgi:hypothetical protein